MTPEPLMIDLMEYRAIRVEKTTCPDCGAKVVLWVSREGTPSYYMCYCGYLGKVGDRRLK